MVGFLNDQYAATYGQEAIRYSLFTLSCTMIFGAFCFYMAGRYLEGDLARRNEV